MLNVKTKLSILTSYLAGVYTGVTEIARAFSVSRKLVYQVHNRAARALEPAKPGPRGGSLAAVARENAQLRAQVAALSERVRTLEVQLAGSVPVTEEKLVDLVLELLVAPVSYDQISHLLGVAYGALWRYSASWVENLVREYGVCAGLTLESLAIPARFRRAAADEVFLGKPPVLTVVEPGSLVVWGERHTDRKGETWAQLFRTFKNLSVVASDQGTGLRSGLARAGLQHQGDLGHLTWKLEAVEKQLWAWCDRALARQKQAEAAHSARRIYRKTYARIRAEVDATFQAAETYLRALESIYTAFQVVNPDTGGLQTPAESIEKTTQALGVLAGFEGKAVAALTRYLDGHLEEFFFFLRDMQAQLQALPIELKAGADPEMLTQARAVIADEIGQRLWLERTGSMAVQEQYLRTCARLRQISGQVKNWKAVYQRANEIVETVLRASSLAETFNSRLRLQQQVKKHISAEYLNLLLLHYNMTPFQEGKRQGHAPLELLGIATAGQDWKQLVREVYRQVA